MKKVFTSLVALFGLSTIFAQTYLSENFNSSTFPSTWTKESTGTGQWAIATAGSTNWPTVVNDGSFAIFDDAVVGSSSYNVAYLTSPSVSIANNTSTFLSFDAVNLHPNNRLSSLSVEVYDGAEWHQIYTTNDNLREGSAAPYSFVGVGPLDVTNYVNANFKFRFKFDDVNTWSYGAGVDNVVLSTPVSNNVTLQALNLPYYINLGTENTLSLRVKNMGNNDVNNITLNWTDGSGDHSSVINVNIPSGSSVEIQHPSIYTPTIATDYNIQFTATSVNGVADSDPSDNTLSATGKVISQNAGTKVVIEEGTGTWCGWCPRGAVAMEYMEENYPDSFIGIAVHNGDPMVLAAYNSGASFNSFPGMNIDRTLLRQDVTQDLMESNTLSRSQKINPIGLGASATINGNDISIDASATFYTSFSNLNYKLAVVLTEDHVTGTASGYRQYNYYSGGGSGVMGGYENLPNPVPAAQMEYNHVGRALLGGYSGQQGSVPTNVVDQQVASYTFNYTLDGNNVNNMHAVVLLIDGSTGQIVNANKFTLNELGVNANYKNAFNVYPNPASDVLNVALEKGGKFNVNIYSLAGQSLLKQKINGNAGETIQIPVSKLSKGVYVISLEGEKESYTKKIIIK